MDWVITILAGLAFAVLLVPVGSLLLTLFVLVPLAHLAPAPPSVSRASFECPFTKRRVSAAFLIPAGSEHPSDVLECSRFGKGPVTCEKGCMALAVAGRMPSPMVPRYSLVSDGEAFR
jgi:hypothetical protein